MINDKPTRSPNAWFAIDRAQVKDPTLALYTQRLKGERTGNIAINNSRSYNFHHTIDVRLA